MFHHDFHWMDCQGFPSCFSTLMFQSNSISIATKSLSLFLSLMHYTIFTHIIPGDVDSLAPGLGPPCLLEEAFPSVGIKRSIVKPMQRDIQDTGRQKNWVNDNGALQTQWNWLLQYHKLKINLTQRYVTKNKTFIRKPSLTPFIWFRA